MKVLFVYTDINVRGGALSYQFGIGQLSAVLKQHGHEARQHHMFGKFDLGPLRRELEEYRPDIVGFTLVYPQFQFVKRILSELRPWQAFVIAGGAHPTVQPEECLRDLPELDAICLGEGEGALLELAEARRDGTSPEAIRNLWVRRPDGGIVRNPLRPFIQDLDTLPFMDREICDYQAVIDSDFKTATFQFGRGCPFDCTYCSNHIIRARQEGAYVRFRSVERLPGGDPPRGHGLRRQDPLPQRRHLHGQEGLVRGVLRQVSRQFDLPIQVNARPEQISEDACRRLAAAHCQRVTMGVEHGNETYRAEVLRRRMSNESIVKAFALCKQYGFRTKAHLLVGLPRETPALHADTVQLTVDILPDSFNLHIFEPYPGTRLADLAVQEKLIDPGRAGTDFIGQTDTVLNMPYFPRQEILRAFRRFPWRVYKHRTRSSRPSPTWSITRAGGPGSCASCSRSSAWYAGWPWGCRPPTPSPPLLTFGRFWAKMPP